jgi:anaerobic ribonucleoside-triphosphate reductase activating protein
MVENNLKLQVAGFLDNSLVNGTGLRSVVFVSGCNHNCKGCQNQAMQDFNYGEKIEVDDIFKRISGNIPLIKGVTFSGGEPFEQAQALAVLASEVKAENLTIWCYTGYTYEYIISNLDSREGFKELIELVDVLIDGRFEESSADPTLKFRGSRNQRIIDVKKSLRDGHIVEIEV